MPAPPQPVFDRLKLSNVRCFAEAELPLHPNVTVVIGGNGAGKTTLTEALASLTWAAPDETEGLANFPLRQGARRGEIALYRKAAAKPAALWNTTRRSSLRQNDLLFAYGRYRRVYMPEAEPPVDDLYAEEVFNRMAGDAIRRRTITLRQADHGLLRDLSGYLLAMDAARRGDPRYETLWAALNRWLRNIDGTLDAIRFDIIDGRRTPVIPRLGQPVRIEHLSDGYQAMLVVIFDLALRYGHLFSDLADPLQGSALVAIDEVDLHLHPRWQRLVAEQLVEMFPKTQFVLTTHSPLVVQGALDKAFSVVTLRERKADHSTTIAPLSSAQLRRMERMEVGSVLYDEKLFDLPSRFSRSYEELLHDVRNLEKRVASARATRRELAELRCKVARLEMTETQEDERRGSASGTAQIARLQSSLVQRLLTELERGRQ